MLRVIEKKEREYAFMTPAQFRTIESKSFICQYTLVSASKNGTISTHAKIKFFGPKNRKSGMEKHYCVFHTTSHGSVMAYAGGCGYDKNLGAMYDCTYKMGLAIVEADGKETGAHYSPETWLRAYAKHYLNLENFDVIYAGM